MADKRMDDMMKVMANMTMTEMMDEMTGKMVGETTQR